MTIDGDFVESPTDWVRDQVRQIERNGTTDGTTIAGRPVVVVTMRGARTGKLRKVPLMRVEDHGVYAVVASMGGAPKNPVWYHNLVAHPRVGLQDGTEHGERIGREVVGEERAVWWKRAVAAFPDYDEYQRKTEREIPVFVLEPLAS